MEEWEEEKFQPLLTSTIWISNYENIKSKLHLPCWNNPIYGKLLTSTIFSIKEEYILGNIELFEEFGIEKFLTTNSLRKNPSDQRILIEYLIDNKISLVIDMKLNPIMNATKKVLKEKYNIDMNELKKEKIIWLIQ